MQEHNSIAHQILSKFPDFVLSVQSYKDEWTVFVKKDHLADVAFSVKNDFGFTMCVDVLGADRFTDQDRFEVIYHLRNYDTADFIRLVVRVDETDLSVPTATHIWSTANWHEREVFDMYGIQFINHPDLRRMYMPQDFEYYPLRKEYPLIGIPGSLTLPEKN